MSAMLAKPYEGQDITGWLMSEKLDGVRALWNGRTLVSRNGNPFAAPDWFLQQLPRNLALDGELFIGRGAFQATVGAVRKKAPVDAEWQRITFMVFDAPETEGGFEQRLAVVAEALRGCPVAKVVEHTPCRNKAHLQAIFIDMTSAGAEGVMLRQPGSAYEPKRSASLLKYKPFDTAEAQVIDHETGSGKNAGLLGALVCRWKDKVFRVGTGLSDALRLCPPAIGTAVTFGFCGLTDGGLPRFPTFVACRDYE